MKRLNALFAASSVGLVVCMGAMVYDDYSRDWKGYQQRFQRLEAEKTRAQIKAAEDQIDKQTLQDLRRRLDGARQAAGRHATDLQAAQAKLRTIEIAAYSDDLAYRTIKSTFDAKKFDYEEAANARSPAAARIAKEMEELQKQLETYRVRGLEHDKEKADAQAAIAAVTGRVDETQKKIDDLEAGITRLQKRLEKVAPTGFLKVALDVLNAPL